MDTNNPAEMSNEDLENDMKGPNGETKTIGNQEHVKKSTATEGELISPAEDKTAEMEVDSLGYKKENADSQDGSMPDPESLDTWETNDDDSDKISG